MKLNRKGYLIVEIIVASVLAMGIAFFLVRLTISFSRKDEDIYKSISFTNDKNIITNKIMSDFSLYTLYDISKEVNAEKSIYVVKFTYLFYGRTSEKTLTIDKKNKTITYGDYSKEIENALEIGDVSIDINDNQSVSIIIPITNIYNDEDYSIRLFVPYSVKSTVSILSLGDYVSYTPSSTSYTTDKSKTGYTSTQTINPSELNLWRVLKVNNDGSVDLISEYTSSVDIYFKGKTGYLNFVGYLNLLAKQYENSNYTKESRYFGYNGQTEYITDESKFTNPAPWTSSTADNSNESQGGGDTLYTDDYNQLNTALGTRVAYKVGTSTATSYWVASRYYYYNSATYYYWGGRRVNASGSLRSIILYDYIGSSFSESSNSYAIRPIVTLKSDLVITDGDGSSSSPYQLLNVSQ